ncbi:MAG: radical SAM protein [Candidatus Omnitrophica bacterium]|nr:radical SAM protein [Candidatus Omnitrophota bacterium]
MPITAKSNFKIALVKIENYGRIFPLGLLYLGNSLKKAGYSVEVFNIFRNEIPAVAKQLINMKPLFVGLSAYTGIQTRCTYEMSMALKELDRNIKVVWGGVHPTMLPEDCLKEDCVDIVCLGEGDELVVKLADHLSQGGDLKELNSIGYKSGSDLIVNSDRHFISNLDDYEPDWTLLPDFEKCVRILPDGRREIDFATSRGCPNSCGFCYNLKFNGKRWRCHSYEYVIEKISYLRDRYNINAIYFNDINFFVDSERAFRILEKLKEMDVSCLSCMLRIDALNEETVKRLQNLGIKRLLVGMESGSNRMLKLIDKKLTREQILEKFNILSKFPNLGVTATSVIGFPTETWEEICQTIDLGVRLAELVPDIIVTFPTFLPYPGSSLYELAVEGGFRLPKSIVDYASFDAYSNTMELTWIPWANKNTKDIFYRIDKYGKLLRHSKGPNILRNLGKNLFYHLSRLRLKHRCFIFPWEIFRLFSKGGHSNE